MTAGPDFELAYALLADEADTRPATPEHVRNALLELAYRALGFSWPDGLQTRSFLGTMPAPLGFEQVNAILAKAGIAPLVTHTVKPPNPFGDLADVMEAFFRDPGPLVGQAGR